MSRMMTNTALSLQWREPRMLAGGWKGERRCGDEEKRDGEVENRRDIIISIEDVLAEFEFS